MTPEKSKPKPPLAPVESCWWEDDIDKYWNWKFYADAEDRSLDRMIEAMRREEAATRAVMNIKDRLLVAGIFIRKTAREHFLREADFRRWAETETDPKKKAELISLANLNEGLGRDAHRREVEAKAKRPRRSEPRRAAVAPFTMMAASLQWTKSLPR